jgi:restriction endonuclease Mrr
MPTSISFNNKAVEYADGFHNTIILVDGHRLVEAMIEHNIRVAEQHAYGVKKIVSNYFEEA